MTKHDDGGAAFSRPSVLIRKEGKTYSEYAGGQLGMTLLDWFAGHMDGFSNEATPDRAAVLAGMTPLHEDSSDKEIRSFWEEADARLRYKRAAAMIAEKRRREAEGGDE